MRTFKINATRVALLVAVVVGVAGLAVLRAQQRKAVLTPQDYMEIQQLVARYAYALDGGLEHGKALADLFTDDGEFHQQTGRVWRGRNELLTTATERRRVLAFYDG